MDLFEAGDRLAACKAPMQPLGLALKQTRKKYSPLAQNELMLVHHCTSCEKASLNRIAADDDSQSLIEIFKRSLDMDSRIMAQLWQQGIRFLTSDDLELVEAQLQGDEYYPWRENELMERIFSPA
jgi:hypothetical protein